MIQTIAEKIAALQALETPALRARWEQALKRPAPKGLQCGALKKKLGLAVLSEKVEGRGRVYRIAAGG